MWMDESIQKKKQAEIDATFDQTTDKMQVF